MNFDYELLEEALQSGFVDSREHFYRLAGVKRHQRARLVGGLFESDRALFDALPAVSPHRSRQHAAMLCEHQVASIHLDRALGQTQKSIAQHYGVSLTTVRDILAGRTWPHLHPTLRRQS